MIFRLCDKVSLLLFSICLTPNSIFILIDLRFNPSKKPTMSHCRESFVQANFFSVCESDSLSVNLDYSSPNKFI
ncbi:unnamed protein product [Trifolium pratense]|uniref:Uncharacterized protein n=1 Tax=Trifolium pratense TaxID=57577 RepID=A0ACB0L1Y7_TRIPR|nr:unnamed protein product [Trifolium pratense]